MTVYVWWVSYHDDVLAKGMWDQAVVQSLIDGTHGLRLPDHPECVETFDREAIPEGDGAVVIIGARHHAGDDDVARLNADLAKLAWVLLILTSDEESAFPVERISHPRMRVWVQTPDPNRPAHQPSETTFTFGCFWPPWFPGLVENVEKEFTWAFMGQVTHPRRQECSRVLHGVPNGVIEETVGFTQGYTPDHYARVLNHTRVAPAPSGPVTPDTFRLYEALEAGCVPVVDEGPVGYEGDYWQTVFDETFPVSVVKDWGEFPRLLTGTQVAWPWESNRVRSWWQLYKRDVAARFRDDLTALGGIANGKSLGSEVTVVVTTSPIESHPDTAVLDETLESVRERLPDCEVLIEMDGVPSHLSHFETRYMEYQRRLLARRWPLVYPIFHYRHRHQAALLADALTRVRTPLVLFVEHDTPLVGDIPWWDLVAVLRADEGDLIRLHHEASVLDVHEHLMLDSGPQQILGVPMRRTAQWSQRPHLAQAGFYRRILGGFFHPEASVFIEDVMHGIVQQAHIDDREQAMLDYRLWLYHPEGDSIKRSTHTDGRGRQSKGVQRFLYPTEQRPAGAPPETR